MVKKLLQLGSLDPMIVAQLRESFGDEFPKAVETYYKDASKYVEDIRLGYEAEDRSQVIRSAHPLKSASESIGAIKVFYYAARMERAIIQATDENDKSWTEHKRNVPHLEYSLELAYRALQKLATDESAAGFEEEMEETKSEVDKREARRAKERTIEDANKKKRPTVLIVDDDTTTRATAASILRQIGMDVDQASDGEIGCDKAVRKTYDIILMDIEMPGIDGFETVRQIRLNEDEKSRSIIIAFSSTFDDLERVALCLRSGMNDCLVKPLQADRLRKRLAHWLELKGIA